MSRARIGSLSILISMGAACVGHGEPEPWAPEQTEVASNVMLTPRTPSPTIPSGRLLGAYNNVEMSVADPVKSADAVRTLVVEAGGEVMGFNADKQQASVTAALDPALAERFGHAVSRLPGTVVQSNSSSNDMSQAVHQLRDRLAKLEHAEAEAEMDQIMRATADRAAFEAWLIQRELNTRERDSLHNQIASYMQQVRRTQFTVTLRSTVEAPGQGHQRGRGFE